MKWDRAQDNKRRYSSARRILGCLMTVALLAVCLIAFSSEGQVRAGETVVSDLASLHLTVGLPGRPPAPSPAWQTSLHVTLSIGSTTIYSQTVMCDAVGAWQMDGLSSGTYDVRVRGDNTLTNLREGLEIAPGTNLVYMGLLRAGDLNGDEAVDIVDFSLFRTRFGTADLMADLDNSGWVDIVDFSLLRASFGLRGPIVLTGEEYR